MDKINKSNETSSVANSVIENLVEENTELKNNLNLEKIKNRNNSNLRKFKKNSKKAKNWNNSNLNLLKLRREKKKLKLNLKILEEKIAKKIKIIEEIYEKTTDTIKVGNIFYCSTKEKDKINTNYEINEEENYFFKTICKNLKVIIIATIFTTTILEIIINLSKKIIYKPKILQEVVIQKVK